MITDKLRSNPHSDFGAIHRTGDKIGRDSPLSAEKLQAHLLQGVSRTFALTIPQLPAPLVPIVSNAYLLCRIVDTIEDEPALTPARKRYFCRQFVHVVGGDASAVAFAAELRPCLSPSTIPAEHELIACVPRVIGITHALDGRQQAVLHECVRSMSAGMVEFQQRNDASGLRDLAQLDRYCYHVAGVVGEMLTELFCDHSPEIARHRGEMRQLAVSFGQGLQMTNILKDIREDRARGACWLPRDVFTEAGVDLRDIDMSRDEHRKAFDAGLERLIGIAHDHLHNALAYTLLIPRWETGIRRFCLWAIGMAILTLRKINRHRDFTCSSAVKISRHSVRATLLASRLAVAHDPLLRSLFHLAGIGLPRGYGRATGK